MAVTRLQAPIWSATWTAGIAAVAASVPAIAW